jgi:hypothetical protein
MKINNIITESAKRPGLWANIHAKQKRIKSGSGERMRKPGSKGAPSDADLKASRTEAVDAGQKRLGPDKNDPWEQGWRAAHRRQDETACPYERGSKEHAQWMDGYDEGAAQPNHYDESVNESSAAADDVSGTLNSYGYYTKNAQDYVHDKTGDKFQRAGSQWKHQSGVKGRGPEELDWFRSSKQGVTEGRESDTKILRLFTFGKSPEQIADELNIDIDTVTDYIKNRMPQSQDNRSRGYSSGRTVSQGMNEQDVAENDMSALAGFAAGTVGGIAVPFAAAKLAFAVRDALDSTDELAKRKARVDTAEIIALQKQIVSINKMLDRVKTDATKEKYQIMLKKAYEVLDELEARQGNRVAENNFSHDPWKDKYFGPTAGALKKIFKVTVQDDESNLRAFNVKAETEKQAMEIIEKHVPGATVKKIKFVQNLMVGRP